MAKLPKGLFFLLAALVLSVTMLVACSSNSEEEDEKATVFDLKMEGGKLNIEDGIIRARQGDNIILRIDADEQGILHLHGYDIFTEVGPGKPTDIEITADATGRFSLTFRPGSRDDVGQDNQNEINLGALEVRPR